MFHIRPRDPVERRDFSPRAEQALTAAIANAKDDAAKAEAYQHRGIWLRIQKQNKKAQEDFDRALDLVGRASVAAARILRDSSLAIAAEDSGYADHLLQQSQEILEKDGKHPDELGSTIGFQGRLAARRGNKAKAIELMVRADATIGSKGNPVYRRNNLAHLVPLLSINLRPRYAIRLIRLAIKTKSPYHLAAAVAGLIGIGRP